MTDTTQTSRVLSAPLTPGLRAAHCGDLVPGLAERGADVALEVFAEEEEECGDAP